MINIFIIDYEVDNEYIIMNPIYINRWYLK